MAQVPVRFISRRPANGLANGSPARPATRAGMAADAAIPEQVHGLANRMTAPLIRRFRARPPGRPTWPSCPVRCLWFTSLERRWFQCRPAGGVIGEGGGNNFLCGRRAVPRAVQRSATQQAPGNAGGGGGRAPVVAGACKWNVGEIASFAFSTDGGTPEWFLKAGRKRNCRWSRGRTPRSDGVGRPWSNPEPTDQRPASRRRSCCVTGQRPSCVPSVCLGWAGEA